ncbi:hypothetical protein LTR53_012227 [Teratosphaeriaceae sp. CCFEE 6253]|nr:hypothetical protein LTR53_012227 [Teratosphaeriaceae sp. CCFEE 6253]
MAEAESGPLDEQAVSSATSAPPTVALSAGKKKQQICRFYSTKNGCRAGATCRFYHPTNDDAATSPPNAGTPPAPKLAPAATPGQSTKASEEPRESKVVPRPTPQAQTNDPRAFEIGQVQRRFKPTVTDGDEASHYAFGLKPSDPDFPYEIETLQCVLTVPKAYPQTGKPTLKVTNNDIPRGFQINIERGFDVIAAESRQATLLMLVTRLDKALETILAGRMAETVKIVTNKGPPSTTIEADQAPAPTQPAENASPAPAPAPAPLAPVHPTNEQRQAAEATQRTHTRQLEARFGRLPCFSKSSDGLTYTLPLESPKRASWPESLRRCKVFTLQVPRNYPIEAATISLDVSSTESKIVEEAFRRLPASLREPTLTQLANHLTQHLREMAIETAPVLPQRVVDEDRPPAQIESGSIEDAATRPTSNGATDDKPHIHHIPRPPEWAHQPREQQDSDDSASETSSSEEDSSGEEDIAEHDPSESSPAAASSAPQEKGVLLSFPQIEIHRIELLELTSLNITVKCERCKDLTEMQRLRSYSGNAADMKQEACKKCASTLAVGFRADLIHVNSARGGYLDLEGCTVVDMLPRAPAAATHGAGPVPGLSRDSGITNVSMANGLPSHFIPTCAECSTAYPAPGIVSVRGDSTFAICRECHNRMSEFLVGTNTLRSLLIQHSAAHPGDQVLASQRFSEYVLRSSKALD